VDLACNLVRILDCDFIVELLADSNLDKTIVGLRILLQIWADRRICIPLFTPPPSISVLYELNLFHFKVRVFNIKVEAQVKKFINIGKKQLISIHI
jgi:hypothetical protein